MSLKSLYSLVLLLLLSASSSFSQIAVSDEASIYSLAVKAIIDDRQSSNPSDIEPLIIIKETMPASSISSQGGKEPRSQKGWSFSFARANQEPIVLTQQFSRDQRFRLVGIDE